MAKVTAIETELQKVYGVKRDKGEDYKSYMKQFAKAMNEDKDDEQWEKLSEDAQAFMIKMTNALNKGNDLPEFPGSEPPTTDEEKPTLGVEDTGDPTTEAAADDKKKATVKTKATAKSKATKPAKATKKAAAAKDDTTKKTAVVKVGDVKKAKPAKAAKPEKAAKPAKVTKAAKGNGADKKTAALKVRKSPKGKSSTVRIKEVVFATPGIVAKDLIAKLKKEGFKVTDSTVISYRTDFLHSLRLLKAHGVKGLPAGLD